ncbi:uncharacterized protein G2W53_041052 [Senna tora]|uniref:Uncharacterized protein n=1 Tax=Senna tora TaxID=362788 RepID=A0A834SF41_9FABA|nr:uncharacterized protein G2W53_041052 [Senna tora]
MADGGGVVNRGGLLGVVGE